MYERRPDVIDKVPPLAENTLNYSSLSSAPNLLGSTPTNIPIFDSMRVSRRSKDKEFRCNTEYPTRSTNVYYGSTDFASANEITKASKSNLYWSKLENDPYVADPRVHIAHQAAGTCELAVCVFTRSNRSPELELSRPANSKLSATMAVMTFPSSA